MSNIRFRPHHFLCTIGFEGKGYSEGFVENYSKIARELRETPSGDETKIEIVAHTDSICEPCPNRREARCETEEKISKLDHAHSHILEIRPGDVLTWGEAKERIRERMTIEKFTAACAPCAWQKAGMCEKALLALRNGIAVLFLGLSLILNPAFADEPLRVKIVGKIKPTKAARALEKGSRMLETEKFAEAIAAVAPFESDPEFGDHALAVKGSAALLSAEHAIGASDDPDKKKKTDWTKIEADAGLALAAWKRIEERDLYSPWWPGAAKEVGKSELALATVKFTRKSPKEATRLFEKAFQRLTLESALYYIRPRHLEAYGDLCLKKSTELCKSWIVKFANHFSKNTTESKSLGKKFPEIVDAAKPTFANSKVTTGYKQKDADEEAFDLLFPVVVEEQWGKAKDALTKFLEDYPRSAHRFRARYWLAKSLDRKGDKDAKTHYEQLVRETPLTVYGLLAMFELKQDIEGRFKGNAPEFVTHDDLQTPLEALRLERTKKLLAAKAYRLAGMDLRSLRSRDSAPGPYLFWLASFASAAESHLTAFSILSDLIARMDETVYTTDGLDLVFPVVEWPTIVKQGETIGVDPILVLSLMKQESAFDREAGSSVGASGYMQLMPFTAADVEADVERRDLLNPEINIRIGTKYLKKMLERYKGNFALALAAYNSGPTAVDRWIREGRASRSFLEFVEQIPYKETRDYVGTIFRNYVWYRFRLRGERVTTVDPFWPGSAGTQTNGEK